MLFRISLEELQLDIVLKFKYRHKILGEEEPSCMNVSCFWVICLKMQFLRKRELRLTNKDLFVNNFGPMRKYWTK
jgi:hypothetical protein